MRAMRRRQHYTAIRPTSNGTLCDFCFYRKCRVALVHVYKRCIYRMIYLKECSPVTTIISFDRSN